MGVGRVVLCRLGIIRDDEFNAGFDQEERDMRETHFEVHDER